jgi:hypothetical protein
MSGAAQGLIGSLKFVAFVPPVENLVTNPSLTTNLTGWEGAGNNSRDTSVFRSSPASLNTYYDGDNIPYAVYSQATGLVVGQKYSLSFWIRTITSRTFRIDFAGSSTTTATLGALSSWQYLKFENVTATSSSLNIAVYNTSGDMQDFNIDDVEVVFGPFATSIPSFSGTFTGSYVRGAVYNPTLSGTNFTSASVTSGSVPSGMTFNFSSNSFMALSGAADTAGTYNFTVTAVNNPGGGQPQTYQTFSYTMTITVPVLQRCTSFQISIGCCTATSQCGPFGAGVSCATQTNPGPNDPNNCS